MKNNWKEKMPANIERIEVDSMPRQVAVEMLCRSNRLTNREHKLYMGALETHYTSTRPAKTTRQDAVLSARLRLRPWATLCRWLKRCNDRRALVQEAFQLASKHKAKLDVKTGKPNEGEVLEILQLNKAIAGLNLRAARLDKVWEAVTEEMKRRQSTFIKAKV